MDDAHTKSSEEIVSFFKTDEEFGLSDDQVTQAQEKYGPNGMLVNTSSFPSVVIFVYPRQYCHHSASVLACLSIM